MTVVNDMSVHMGVTSYKFGINDVCNWRIKIGSVLQFMRQIKIKIEQVTDVNCYIAYGNSV